jgi:hypothetical protein
LFNQAIAEHDEIISERRMVSYDAPFSSFSAESPFESSLIFDAPLRACCKFRVTFRISLDHIAENNIP